METLYADKTGATVERDRVADEVAVPLPFLSGRRLERARSLQTFTTSARPAVLDEVLDRGSDSGLGLMTGLTAFLRRPAIIGAIYADLDTSDHDRLATPELQPDRVVRRRFERRPVSA